MSEFLTIEQIESRYAPDWVLIGDPRLDDTQRLLGGSVLDHGPDRDELYRRASRLGLNRIAVRYLGPWPEDMVLVL